MDSTLWRMTEQDLQLYMNAKLIEMTDVCLRYFNPCHMDGSSCLVAAENPCCQKGTRFGSPCPFMQNNQCKNPNIECKLWFCETAIKQMPEHVKQVFIALESLAKQFLLVHPPFFGESYGQGADHP